MKIEASVGRTKNDVRDRCYSLRISSSDERDMATIAVLYRLVAGLRVSGLDNWVLNRVAEKVDHLTDQLLRQKPESTEE